MGQDVVPRSSNGYSFHHVIGGTSLDHDHQMSRGSSDFIDPAAPARVLATALLTVMTAPALPFFNTVWQWVPLPYL